MIPTVPLNAGEIGIEWPISEGGIGVTARTDRTGLPYIGLYPLSPMGLPAGQPTVFARDRLLVSVVAGYSQMRIPITVFIDVEITRQGMTLRINMPVRLMRLGYERYLKTTWGKPSPRICNFPSNSNWAVPPWPEDGQW
jgi:hypothetical protein